MKQLFNTVGRVCPEKTMEQNAAMIGELIKECNCDGIELIYDGTDRELASMKPYVTGYHLTFYPDWVDFWTGNFPALKRKFGSSRIWKEFYSGETRKEFVRLFQEDLRRAEALGAEYVVFHVSDVSIEEGYTYRWEHTDEEVADASLELINELLAESVFSFEFLIENLQWPGFSFTRPEITERILSGIHYEKKGIMLDIGHLMCTNLELRNQAEGCRYAERMLQNHGSLTKFIRGIHLHQSVTGAYVKESIKRVLRDSGNYYERFRKSYDHIRRIDTHQPFSDPAAAVLVERIQPEYLIHELSAASLSEKKTLIRMQQSALGLLD